MQIAVKVDGLRSLDRALGEMGSEVRKEFRKEMKAVAEVVAADARRRVPVRSGQARRSVRATFSGSSAAVRGGKKRVPYYGWLDFGTRSPRSGRPRSVGPWRGTGSGPAEGRFIYPAIRENQVKIRRMTEEVVDRARRRAGL